MENPSVRKGLRVSLVLAALALCVQGLWPNSLASIICLILGLVFLGFAWNLHAPRQLELESIAVPGAEDASAQPDLLVSAGHDMRQPVQAIALFTASLEATQLPESSRKLVAGIDLGVQSLSGMLEAIFGIAKLQAGRIDCQSKTVALEPLFARVIDEYLDIAHSRHFHLRHASTKKNVQADPSLLFHVLNHLLRCAVDQTGEGGILLGCRQRGKVVWLELRVTNDFKCREKLHERRFIPNERLCSNVPDKGYGLAYAQGLAELMGGQLEAFVFPGRGSLLRVSLSV